MDGKRRPRAPDATIGDLAERQHGVVARWQLEERGIRRGAIDGRIARGSLHRILRGVYAVGRPTVSWHGRLMAAALSCGSRAVLSHRCAAQAWGLMPRAATKPEVTVAGNPRARTDLVMHRSTLLPDELGEVRGIPATSVARTLLDIAPLTDKRGLERAWNEMEARRLWGTLSVPELLARHPGRRGVTVLREVAASGEPAGWTRSELEEQFVRLVDDHELPRPRINAHLALRGRFFEIDALWERERLAVELDGAVHRTRRAFQRDRERDRILLAEGYRTARVTWDQLRDEPGQIAGDLRAALRR